MTTFQLRDDVTKTVVGEWESRETAERARATYQANYKRSFTVVAVIS